MKKEYLRQLIHASGIFIVFLSWFLNPALLIIICIAIVIAVEILFRIDRYHNIFFISALLNKCKRKNDEKGFVYFFLGIILTIYLFQFNMAVANAAIIILLFGDSASTIFGKKYGKTQCPCSNKGHHKKCHCSNHSFLFIKW